MILRLAMLSSRHDGLLLHRVLHVTGRVLDVLAGVLGLGGLLLGLALALHAIVVGRPASRLLDLALRLFGLVLGLVTSTHEISSWFVMDLLRPPTLARAGGRRTIPTGGRGRRRRRPGHTIPGEEASGGRPG